MKNFKCVTRVIGNYRIKVHHLRCPDLKRPTTDFKRKYSVIVDIEYCNKKLSKLGLNNISMVTSQGHNQKNAIEKAVKSLRNQRFAWSVQNSDYAYQRYYLSRKIKTHTRLRDLHLNSDAPDLQANATYVNHNNSKIRCLTEYLDTLKDI